MSQRIRGKVKWFNDKKGFGFIAPISGGDDVFVHITQVQASGMSTLGEGQMVEFELENNRGKSAAARLQKVA